MDVGAALYGRGPDKKEVAAVLSWGLRAEDIDLGDTPVPVWPENVTAVRVFLAMDTQWSIGMGGASGLNYAALSEVWRRLKVPPDERDEAFDGLRVLEKAALAQMHKKDD